MDKYIREVESHFLKAQDVKKTGILELRAVIPSYLEAFLSGASSHNDRRAGSDLLAESESSNHR